MTILDIAQKALTSHVLSTTQESVIEALLGQQAFDHVDMAVLAILHKALSSGEVVRA